MFELRIDCGNTCSILMNRKMYEIESSELTPAMAASRTFDSILQQIQTSNLNFQLQISPFSANIAIKKTPIKDRSGAPILPPPSHPFASSSLGDIGNLVAEKRRLEKDLNSLRYKHERVVDDCAKAYQQIRVLEAQSSVKVEANESMHQELFARNDLMDNLMLELKELKEENEVFKTKIESQNIEIQDLEKCVKQKSDISKNLNKRISDLTVKFNKEKSEIFKEHKAEVKFWRKELGEETSKITKLEKELKAAERSKLDSSLKETPEQNMEASSNLKFSQDQVNVCTVCANNIKDYIPEYFMGDVMNAACEKCKEASADCDYEIADSSTKNQTMEEPDMRIGRKNTTGIFSDSNDILENNSDDLKTETRQFNDAFKEEEGSAPLTKRDVEDCLKMMSALYKK